MRGSHSVLVVVGWDLTSHNQTSSIDAALPPSLPVAHISAALYFYMSLPLHSSPRDTLHLRLRVPSFCIFSENL